MFGYLAWSCPLLHAGVSHIDQYACERFQIAANCWDFLTSDPTYREGECSLKADICNAILPVLILMHVFPVLILVIALPVLIPVPVLSAQIPTQSSVACTKCGVQWTGFGSKNLKWILQSANVTTLMPCPSSINGRTRWLTVKTEGRTEAR